MVFGNVSGELEFSTRQVTFSAASAEASLAIPDDPEPLPVFRFLEAEVSGLCWDAASLSPPAAVNSPRTSGDFCGDFSPAKSGEVRSMPDFDPDSCSERHWLK